MKTAKDAADSLLSKGSITQEDYNLLKEANIFNMTKTSGFFQNVKGPLSAVAIAGAIGLAGKELIVDPLIQMNRISNSFEDMQKKVPSLAGKDQEDMKDYFNVVKTFSPKAASNPLVAGALVNKMMEFGGVDHKLVQDIAAIQAGLMKPTVIETATQAAAKAITGKQD